MKTASLRRTPFAFLPRLRARHWAALALALGCASCNFAPAYRPPPVAVPAAFKEGQPPSAGAAETWQPAKPNDAAARGAWWERYGDPVLNSLEEQVRLSNQTIQGAAANFRNARALAMEARASLFPTATGSASFARGRSSQTYNSSVPGAASAGGASGAPGAITDQFDLPLDASYTLDLWGRLRNAYAATVDTAQAGAADLATAVLSTQAELANDYFALRAVDEQRRIYSDTVASYRQTLALTHTLFDSGIDSDEDLATAQVQLDTVVAQATDLGVARAQYEHAIAVLIGKPPSVFSIAIAPFKPQALEVPAGVPSDLLQRRPDIASAERQVAAANAQVGVARTAYFPNLTLAAEAGFESSQSSNWLKWPSRFWSIGPALGGTIFDVGGLRAVNDQAHAQYDQAVASYRQTVLAAFQAVEDNLAALRILGQEAVEERTAVASAEHYLALAQTRYRAGIDSSLNVEVAQNLVLTNRQTQVQIQLRQAQASVALVMALGGGWDTSMLPERKDISAHPPKWRPATDSPAPPQEPVAAPTQ
ncbi:MAG: efflux transporter outer membrane subunit [Opitutaceae bacterium]|jgi:NodT family efflux transporter outer membrane factor (OMF) lipoprotein